MNTDAARSPCRRYTATVVTMMKYLRILTGFHAGAQLSLRPGSYHVGASEDSDIRLTDWKGADAVLHADNDGIVHLSYLHDADELAVNAGNTHVSGQPARDLATLSDFVPVRFGELVITVGPTDAKWPSDIDLLATVLARPVEPVSGGKLRLSRQMITLASACVLLGAMSVVGILINTTESSHATPLDYPAVRAQDLSNALVAARLDGVRAQAVGKTIVVSGMVLNEADDRAARRIISQFQTGNVVERNYDIAQQVTRSIGDMLGVDGAYVTYLGNGRFAVNGPAIEKRELQTAIARARDDLSANVTAVELRTSGPSGPELPGPAFSEMLSAQNVRFAQTPDGVKHFFYNNNDTDVKNDSRQNTDDKSITQDKAPSDASYRSTATPPEAQ
jgi:type III secretion protein D